MPLGSFLVSDLNFLFFCPGGNQNDYKKPAEITAYKQNRNFTGEKFALKLGAVDFAALETGGDFWRESRLPRLQAELSGAYRLLRVD